MRQQIRPRSEKVLLKPDKKPIRRRWYALVAGVAVVLGSAAVVLAATGTGPSSLPVVGAAGAVPRVIGPQDGFVPDGGRLSPFDTDLPAIANLDPRLLRAVQEAARDAAGDGVDFHVTTGWRSRAYQRQLLDEAVVKYASEEEARKYVSPPERSHHVTGDAVDIGPTDADSWLSQHGADYGLCQTYGNEMWHFELATEPGGTCPPMRADASEG